MLQPENIQMIRAATSISILVKIVDSLEKRKPEYSGKGASLDYLFNGVLKAHEKHRVTLYGFCRGFDGKTASPDFWKDIEHMNGWGYATVEEDNIKLTNDGKEFAKSLKLDEEVKTVFEEIFFKKESD